mmetsp:Transcript_15981/g.36253  ORF Transcript_15981/g.36253 Transcript_15981/m.36253 type:complete len:173 (+) Transcript_15981:68-586(+)|eukprot:CAMPEP_0197872908 /NCGR_PEP_ID=MMETSP1439-20131203/2882_1 /TAXON_ID=66791 /ORGANISM="Gonyaulax spinifera, Strain CCMP409" /LENGTH=172 /DNA_ID=CAMNT_0043491939 /DNA_START=68 /DNA_END=586 /DNA_ORIENTATION=+
MAVQFESPAMRIYYTDFASREKNSAKNKSLAERDGNRLFPGDGNINSWFAMSLIADCEEAADALATTENQQVRYKARNPQPVNLGDLTEAQLRALPPTPRRETIFGHGEVDLLDAQVEEITGNNAGNQAFQAALGLAGARVVCAYHATDPPMTQRGQYACNFHVTFNIRVVA